MSLPSRAATILALLPALAVAVPASEHGAEIEDPVVVNHVYASEDYYASQDFDSSVALDEHGRGVAVWSTRSRACEPVAAVTLDGGRNWSRHIPLKTSEVEPGNLAMHDRPVLATDREGTWIAAWSTREPTSTTTTATVGPSAAETATTATGTAGRFPATCAT